MKTNTIDEQFKIQYNEIKSFWKKKRKRRSLIFLILTIISIIGTIILSSSEYFTLLKYSMLIIIIACITCTIRELIIPTKQEIKELNQLKRIYNEERFKEKNG